jgi:hypothetical protein
MFLENDFGYECALCDRLWFKGDLKKVTPGIAWFLLEHFPDEDTGAFVLCNSCQKNMHNKVPPLSRSNGFKYPPKPEGLPTLDPISERLISPRMP